MLAPIVLDLETDVMLVPTILENRSVTTAKVSTNLRSDMTALLVGTVTVLVLVSRTDCVSGSLECGIVRFVTAEELTRTMPADARSISVGNAASPGVSVRVWRDCTEPDEFVDDDTETTDIDRVLDCDRADAAETVVFDGATSFALSTKPESILARSDIEMEDEVPGEASGRASRSINLDSLVESSRLCVESVIGLMVIVRFVHGVRKSS